MSEKAEKFNTDAFVSDIALISQIQEERNLLSRKEVIRLLCDFFRGIKSDALENCPENCKNCELFGGLNGGKVLCILKIENKQPSFKHHSIFEANACSTKSMLITLVRKEELTKQIDALNKRLQYLEPRYEKYKIEIEELRPAAYTLKQREKEIEELKQPLETLLTEKTNLETELQNMKNALVMRIEEIASLETDNAQLRQANEELKHDALLEKNAALIVQLGKKEQDIADLKSEIEKLEALVKTQKQTISDITSKTSETFRDILQFKPSTLEPYEVSAYLKNVEKTIVNLEGYLNTVSA